MNTLIPQIVSATFVIIFFSAHSLAFIPRVARNSAEFGSRSGVSAAAVRRRRRPALLLFEVDRKRPIHVLKVHNQDRCSSLDRRRLFTVLPSLVSATILAQATSRPALAASTGDGKQAADTIWLTGKPPRVPGAKPKDKNDVSGTKKDPSFLRSIADCKNQCENVSGPDGLSKSKEECLSECQDICCTTYEQCTFAIVPRI